MTRTSATGSVEQRLRAGFASLEERRRAGAPRGPHRLAALCAALGDPHLAAPTVRVVGTDGKTSVSRLLGSCLAHLGIRAGVTTSPHLHDTSERFAVDGRPVASASLWPALAEVLAALPSVDRELGERVTYFEAVTAIALQVFAASDVEVVVLEAGIGGIGDATAAVPARVLVLTPVGLDHPELGATRAVVAREKAGVLATGGVLVSGPQHPEVDDVLDRLVRTRGATWSRHGRDHDVAWRMPDPDGQRLAVTGPWGSLEARLALHGAHQAANAATAIAALHAHLGRSSPPTVLRRALAAARVPGRTERLALPSGVELVLDGAHDLAAVEALVASLRELPGARATHVLLRPTGGRDPRPWITSLAEVADTIELLRHVDGLRELRRVVHGSVAGDRVVVTGSLHLVGEAREAFTPTVGGSARTTASGREAACAAASWGGPGGSSPEGPWSAGDRDVAVVS